MPKNEPTPTERILCDALIKRGVPAKLGYNDGFKTVDIAVLPAQLYIEVDDLSHFTDPDRIISDLNRSHFSDGDDYRTFYVTNQIINKYVNEVADAIAEVVKRRTDVRS